jgi:SAM-dependent methyltransferase
MFRALLEASSEMGGDLAELGVLLGRSAALVGSYLQEGETFTVLDLFESPADEAANARENRESYPGLERSLFEANYLNLHGELPVVVQGLSKTITDHVPIGTHRFLHVDASHLYEHVTEDIVNARRLLKPDGIIALDDFRAEHTPGVAAAAWQAVVTSGLRPFAVSPSKMYATWGDGERWRSALEAWANASPFACETQRVNGQPLLRVGGPETRPHWLKSYIPPIAWSALVRAKQRHLKNRTT